MGVVQNISATEYPRQSKYLHATVGVCFNYDTRVLVGGIIVRDDIETPFRTIIRLDDGRFVLGSECQYTIRQRPAERTGGGNG